MRHTLRRRHTDSQVNWEGIMGGFGACLFSGLVWYALLIGFIAFLRFLGVHIAGVWPLSQ